MAGSWFARHIILTPQERLMVAGILLIALCGLGVRHCRSTTATTTPPPAQTKQPAR